MKETEREYLYIRAWKTESRGMHDARRRRSGEEKKKKKKKKGHACTRWSKGRRVMLDEDENPLECTECIWRTCLQTWALTGDGSDRARERGVLYPRMGEHEHEKSRRPEKLDKKDRRENGWTATGSSRTEPGRREILPSRRDELSSPPGGPEVTSAIKSLSQYRYFPRDGKICLIAAAGQSIETVTAPLYRPGSIRFSFSLTTYWNLTSAKGRFRKLFSREELYIFACDRDRIKAWDLSI